MYTKKELEAFSALKQCVIDMEEEKAEEISRRILQEHWNVKAAITEGLIAGMDEVSRLYADEIYFLPDLLTCADVMETSMRILRTALCNESVGYDVRIVIGTVEGDTHDIGKNIVALFLECAGFQVYDAGRDVSAKQFVQKVQEVHADILCLSTIMTTTMDRMSDVIRELEHSGLRDRVKVMVGGKPVSPKFAKEIGADGYSNKAADAVKLAKELSGVNS